MNRLKGSCQLADLKLPTDLLEPLAKAGIHTVDDWRSRQRKRIPGVTPAMRSRIKLGLQLVRRYGSLRIVPREPPK